MYETPAKAGYVFVTQVDLPRFTLEAENGTVFVFNVTTRQWEDSGSTPVPTPDGGAGAFLEQNGQVVVEAEHATQNIARGNHSWVARSDISGFVGAGFMRSAPNTGAFINSNYAGVSPELQYPVQFSTPGTYTVWLRGYGSSTYSDSAHVGLDGQELSSANRINATAQNVWNWTNSTTSGPVATITISTAGLHTINVWMREDGYRLDRIVLTTSAAAPSGDGPAESPRT